MRLEAYLWSAVNNLRANSDLRSSEYPNPNAFENAA